MTFTAATAITTAAITATSAITASTSATPTEPTTMRKRTSTILTDRMCQRRVTKREKFYARKCPGLYVSIIPAGVATFNFKFLDCIAN